MILFCMWGWGEEKWNKQLFITKTMQYTEIFSSVKNENFMRKNDILKFQTFFSLKFSQNIDCGYSLEPLHRISFYMFVFE